MTLVLAFGLAVMTEYILGHAFGFSHPAEQLLLGFAVGVLFIWAYARLSSRRWRFLD